MESVQTDSIIEFAIVENLQNQKYHFQKKLELPEFKLTILYIQESHNSCVVESSLQIVNPIGAFPERTKGNEALRNHKHLQMCAATWDLLDS